jgi:hypothetical protein
VDVQPFMLQRAHHTVMPDMTAMLY